MKPRTQNPRKAEIDRSDVSSTQLFAALAEERRQYALGYLSQKTAAIQLGDLAEYIALKEGEPSYDRYQRIVVDLHHRHLPHLRDAGLVRYDDDAELLELAVDRDVVAPYLRLADHTE
ncbi:DUF7344 domain-containing protein [Natronorubrum texcoconense]|uniref:DUF7344 domain-containing protein n=1 Tax=Natronorubrum texcoconense TaxID=1095776 RepID=A0A1G8TMS2_9EURY|nr:hypothetical protein [Natronorubrum texcoconense]SDJ41980.1 hypothetical protein SAMN04515672_0503 [Natronorubrum texcoconense]